MRIGLRPLLKFSLALGGSAAIAASPVAQEATPAPADQSLAAYASSEDSVRLPDGRSLHLVCMGKGSPTVILTAGNTRWSIDWSQVQSPVAASTRVCAWDRPGIGLSDPPLAPQTVDQTSADLANALEIGRIAGPYVLVGHSLGSYESLLLADRNPSSVVGIVLVDPAIPDQAARFERVAPAVTEAIGKGESPLVRFLRDCAAALRSGALKKGGPDPDGCLRRRAPPSNFPPELVAAMPTPERTSEDVIASTLDALAFSLSSEMSYRNGRIVVKPHRNYGSIPIVVLTADQQFPAGANWSPDAKAQLPLQEAEFRLGHHEYASLSTLGVQRVVADSTHDIHLTHPEAVIEAITEVVRQARTSD